MEKSTLKEYFEWLLPVFSRCYSSIEFTLKKLLTVLWVSIFLPTLTLDPLQNIIKTDYYCSVLNDVTLKNLKMCEISEIYWQNWTFVGQFVESWVYVKIVNASQPLSFILRIIHLVCT